MRVGKLFIGGEWCDAEQHDEILDPFSGSVVGTAAVADAAALDRATDAALAAFGSTRTHSAYRRRQVLHGIAAGLRDRFDEVAALIVAEAGKPITFARAEVGRAISTFTLAAEELSRFGGEIVPIDIEQAFEGCLATVRRFPIGPVAAISPFNFPLNLVAHKLAPAVAVGSTVVLKPAPQAPLTALLLAEIAEQAGIVPGQLNVVNCPPVVAQRLVTDSRIPMLTFTGSAAVGWHLKSIAGRKKVLLELGGNCAAVVHDDADLDWAVRRCVAGAFAYAGQVCISLQRLFVHEPIYDAFRDRLVSATRDLPCGDPRDATTVSGPVIDDRAARRIVEWIDEARAAGAAILTGGSREGRLIAPTVIENAGPEMRVVCEEVFGPVVVLDRYRDFDEALRQVNASAYGLQAAVFTNDARRIHRAFEQIEVGGVIVNDAPMVRVDNYPYGGVKASGLGREGVRYAMEEMTEVRVLVTRH
jgi:glyceraldehyde-3-phosphate dehydrogenase (NADP+)